MAINKVVYGNNTLVDLTEDTVTENKVLEGETFHDASGQKRTGSLIIPVQDVEVNGESVVDENGIAEVVVPVSGDVSTTDSFESYTGGKVKSAQMELLPIQNLHGYDHPWVGGAGKNKLPLTIAKLQNDNVDGTWNGNVYSYRGIDFTISVDDGGNVIEIDVNGISNADYATLNVNSSITQGSYILNGISNGSSTGLRFDLSGIGSYKTLTNGSISVVADTDVTYNFIVTVRSSGANVNHHKVYPMIRLSTESDSTFEPYTNICPISGHTEVDLQSDGKNKADVSNAVSATNVISGVSSDGIISIKDVTAQWSNTYIGTVYLRSGVEYTMSASNMVYGRFGLSNTSATFPKEGTYIPCVDKVSSFTGNLITRNRTSVSFTPVNSGFAYIWYCSDDQYSSYHATFSTTLQIEQGNQATPYEPYLGHLYQVQIGSTVYDGTVDLVSGNLDSAFGVVDLGSLNWTYDSSYPRFYSEQIADMKSSFLISTDDLICEALKTNNAPISGSVVDNTICGYTNHRLYVNCYAYTDKTAFTTAMAGIKCVYRKETPSAISTIPQQIEALVGENNFFAPLEGQEIIEIVARNIAEFNEVIDDENISDKFTYSSEKIEDRLDEYAEQIDVRMGEVEDDIDTLTSTKQDALTFDENPTANSDNPVTSNGIKTAIDTVAGTIVTGTLTAGSTTVTLNNAKITTNSTIDIYTTVYGLNPTNVTVVTGSITLTFEAQQSNVGVKVRIT